MNNNTTHYTGIGVTGLLGVVFVVLKLIHIINWSWWWVTAPFWGPIAITIFILIVIALVAIYKGD